MKIFLIIIFVGLLSFSISQLFLLYRNNKAHELQAQSIDLIHSWIILKSEESDFEWYKDWYDFLLKSYEDVMYNVFINNIKGCFKDPNMYYMILEDLEKKKEEKVFDEF